MVVALSFLAPAAVVVTLIAADPKGFVGT